jgi:hypothetical protein
MKTHKKKTTLEELYTRISLMEMNLKYYNKKGQFPTREQYKADIEEIDRIYLKLGEQDD